MRYNEARRAWAAQPDRIGEVVRHHQKLSSVVRVKWPDTMQVVSVSIGHLVIAPPQPRCAQCNCRMLDGICQNYGCETGFNVRLHRIRRKRGLSRK